MRNARSENYGFENSAPQTTLPITIRRVEQAEAMLFRGVWLRSGVTFARISALPLFLLGSTGWVPNEMLDVPPKGPWPWGAIVGLSIILVALYGLASAARTSSAAPSVH